MDPDLCLEPLLAEFFDPARFTSLTDGRSSLTDGRSSLTDGRSSLRALLGVSQVNRQFYTYFQCHERAIYLRLIQARLELDASGLSLVELRQFLVRAPELFEEKEVPLTIVALSDTPKLFLLALPRLQRKNIFYVLTGYARVHDSSQTYAAIIKSYPSFFTQEIDHIYVRALTGNLIESKSVGCLCELFLGIPPRFYLHLLVKLQTGGGNCFILPVLSNYCQVTGKTLDDLLTHTTVEVESILPRFYGEELEFELEDYLKLVSWVLSQTIDDSFRQHPSCFLLAAATSEETFSQLLLKFPQQLADREWLQHLRQYNYLKICSREPFPKSLRQISEAGLLSAEEVEELAKTERYWGFYLNGHL